MQWMKLMMIMCSETEEDGNVRSVREMKAPIIQIKTVTLVDKGR
jgi:hypothetical protein